AEDGIRDFHVTGVQTCALPICSGGKCIGSLLNAAPPGLLERMSLGSSLVEAAQTLRRSSGRLPNSGMAWPGRFLTLNTSEWRNEIGRASCREQGGYRGTLCRDE